MQPPRYEKNSSDKLRVKNITRGPLPIYITSPSGTNLHSMILGSRQTMIVDANLTTELLDRQKKNGYVKVSVVN